MVPVMVVDHDVRAVPVTDRNVAAYPDPVPYRDLLGAHDRKAHIRSSLAYYQPAAVDNFYIGAVTQVVRARTVSGKRAVMYLQSRAGLHPQTCRYPESFYRIVPVKERSLHYDSGCRVYIKHGTAHRVYHVAFPHIRFGILTEIYVHEILVRPYGKSQIPVYGICPFQQAFQILFH